MSLEGFSFHARHSIHDCPSFHFEIEELRRGDDQMLLIHINVHRWSRSSLTEMRDVWQRFRSCVTAPIFGFGVVDDTKFERFARMFGFTPFSHVLCNDGLSRRLFIHVKDFP